MKYVLNAKVGVVHTADCPALARMKPENLTEWDPAKAHLAPGVTPCPACLSKVPAEEPEKRTVTLSLDAPPGLYLKCAACLLWSQPEELHYRGGVDGPVCGECAHG